MPHDPFNICLAALLGVASLVAFADAWVTYRRRRRSNYPPPPKGQLHLFDAEGGHFLSATLPAPGLQKLLEDYNRGRFD